jgi:biotin carboxyl carrier protein
MIADVVAPITGVVWKILVNAGEKVVIEQSLILLESMKMEVSTPSPATGVVATILVQPGDAVEEGDKLATVRQTSDTAT